MRWVRRLVCVVLAAQATLARADESTRHLPEVVVTATRTRSGAADLPNTVSVVSGEDIRVHDDASVTEALRGTPGLDVTEFGTPGRSAFASIRGAAPDQVVVLLDGVEVNTPTVGQFDFANLLADNLARIEIVRGGGGTLYGANAIGGVINALTEKGEGPFRLRAATEGGRFGTFRDVLGINGAHGPLALSGSATYLSTDGARSINDDYRNFSTVWRADADLIDGGTLRTFLRYSDARAGLVNFNAVEGIPDPNAHSRNDFFLSKGEWEHTLGDGLTYRTAVSYVKNNERFHDTQPDPNEPEEIDSVIDGAFPSEIVDSEAQADYAWRGVSVSTIGVDFKEQSAHVYEHEFEEDEGEDETEAFDANRSTVSLYGQEQVTFLDHTLRGVGGVRYDHIDDFGDQVTTSGSGSYLLRRTDTRLRVSYATGFRAPTFDELFEPTLGNPELEAEESWEINGGVTQSLWDGRVRFEPTYFYREVTDFIEELADQLPGPLAGVPEGGAAENVNARFQGVELITRGRPLSWLSAAANYTYLNFSAADGVLLNRPRHRGFFGVLMERPDVWDAGDRATAALQVYAVGSRASANPQHDFAPSQLGGYARVDLALAYEAGGALRSLTVTATVRNLFNRDYEEAIGFPAPPAWFMLGLRYQL